MQERVSFHDQISRNKVKSFILIFIIFLITVALIWVISRAWGGLDIFIISIMAVIISLSYLLIMYYNSDKIAIMSVGDKPADKIKSPDGPDLSELSQTEHPEYGEPQQYKHSSVQEVE